MNDAKILNRLILADVALAAVSLSWSRAQSAPNGSSPVFALWASVCAATLFAWVGLLFRHRAARPLYAASWAGYLLLVALRGGFASSEAGSILDLASGLVGGMILAVVYFSEARLCFGFSDGAPAAGGALPAA